MAKPSETPGFKSLQAEWYSKLADEGFRDIENSGNESLPLKKPGTVRRYERMAPVQIESKAQYFRRVAQHVAETCFEVELERQILGLYAEGYSQKQIQEVLGIQGHRCKVYYPLYRWLEEWGLK